VSGALRRRDGCDPLELVKAFGDRIYSIAKHITQNDEDAEDGLIQAFLEFCPVLDGCLDSGTVWLRLVTVAVREAFSKLRNRGEDLFPSIASLIPMKDLVFRKLTVWGDDCNSPEETRPVLEHWFRSLDPMCRTVFALREIEEITVEQIATMVNRSVAAVGVCLLRARLLRGEMLTQQMRQPE
jgi:RNA polymerase sigma-70 factor (ECF subfamily)